jgi:hypothetical protein
VASNAAPPSPPSQPSIPKPARAKLTNAEKIARQQEKALREARQLDILRVRALADDAKQLRGIDRKTAGHLAREASALAVLAGRLGPELFLKYRTEIEAEVAALQESDPATAEAVAALHESGTEVRT